ncbi:anti-sigma factor [Flavobacterium sp. LaA7.5]|nr:anti-sigma factor [Flavobacterium salilacus subsp. altitudinum]
MSSNELIESGTLELFVFGLLSEAENNEVQEMAKKDSEVQDEIIAIEKAVINLSYSISPRLSAQNYNRIYAKLIEKQEGGVVQMDTRRSGGISQYIGWAAAVILLIGIGIQYMKYNEVTQEAEQATAERNKFEQMVASIEQEKTQTERALEIVRDKGNAVISLDGQQVAPDAYAKIYVNKDDNETYVDIAGLPEPPEGKVYQVWALKLSPFTPTSIGVLDASTADANKGIYKVDTFEGVEAFGITLEPAGGSQSPTLEQLYTLGKV